MNSLYKENKYYKASTKKKVNIDFQLDKRNIKCFPFLKQHLCCPPPRNTSRQSFYLFPPHTSFSWILTLGLNWPHFHHQNATTNSSKVKCAFILKWRYLMKTFRGIVFSSPLLSPSLSAAGSLKAPPPPQMEAPASMKCGRLALVWKSNED